MLVSPAIDYLCLGAGRQPALTIATFPWLIYEYAEEVENHAGEIDEHILAVQLTDQAKNFYRP